MKNWPFWVGCLAVAIIAVFYLWPERQQLPTSPTATTDQPPAPAKTPNRQYPISALPEPLFPNTEELQLDRPLPALEQSDTRMKELLAVLFREQNLERLFFLEHFVERFVVMVDNLPRGQLPPTHRPVRKISGDFLVKGPPTELTIDPANARRYAPLLNLVNRVDQNAVIAVYTSTYPLFQSAYEKLGYPDRYFNDRLVEVIDHLLQTPVLTDPIFLTRPKYSYQFADPQLEALSAGQKIILRTGPENAALIRKLLRTYRQRLSGVATPG